MNEWMDEASNLDGAVERVSQMEGPTVKRSHSRKGLSMFVDQKGGQCGWRRWTWEVVK